MYINVFRRFDGSRGLPLLGKASLNAPLWAHSPDLTDADFLSTNRFFKVSVELK